MTKTWLAVAAAMCSASLAAFEVRVGAHGSLAGARDEVRAARASGRIGRDEPVTITIAQGTYGMDAGGLELCAEDSGTENGLVVWRAEKPGSVRFLGGTPLASGAFGPVADAAVLARLDVGVRSRVKVADVSACLSAEERKPWPDSIRGVLPSPWLYRNGRQLPVARWPNADEPEGGMSGFTVCLSPGGDEWKQKTVPPKPGATDPGSFEFPSDRAARWRFADGVWMLGYWKYDWACEYLRAASFDPSTRELKLATWAQYGLGKGNNGYFKTRRFYALNLLDELDSPGEWYLDRKNAKLYYLPVEDGEKDDLVLAQAAAPFVRMKGVSHVVFENISFECSHGGAAFVMDDCSDCAVRNCAFANHAGNAIVVKGERNVVSDTKIRGNGATAISVSGGNRVALIPANNVVERCEISDYAVQKRIYAPAISLSGCGNAVRNCRVHDGPYIALWYYGNEHLIADNEFGHVVQEAGDSGCIYQGKDSGGLGTLIFGNYIHDLARTPREANARNGIYFDDCDWGDDVVGNTFRHAGRAVFIGGGKLHGVYNNLVVDSRSGVHVDGRGRTWRKLRNSFGYDKKGRSFALQGVEGFNFRYAPWSVVYPSLGGAVDSDPELPGMNEVKGNLFHNCAGRAFDYDAIAQSVLPSNTNENPVTSGESAPARAPQPIRLADAAENALQSPDGRTVATFSLDGSAHFGWTLRKDGHTVLRRSPLGVTVGRLCTWKLVVPRKAQFVGESQASVTNIAAKTWREYKIGLVHLVSGRDVATLEVRVWDGGAACRWIVPGSGRRRIVGENTALFFKAADARILEFERPDGYPEAFWYDRWVGRGVSFPERPRGWMHEGDVVTPWRGVAATR